MSSGVTGRHALFQYTDIVKRSLFMFILNRNRIKIIYSAGYLHFLFNFLSYFVSCACYKKDFSPIFLYNTYIISKRGEHTFRCGHQQMICGSIYTGNKT